MIRAGGGGWGGVEAKEAKECNVLEAVLPEKGGSPEPIPIADLESQLNLDPSTIGFAVESLCLAGLMERVDEGAVQATQAAARFWALSDYMHF